MPKSLAAVLLTAFASTAPCWASAGTALAQGAQPGAQPSLPPAPQPTPSFQVGPRAPGALPGGSGNYAVSAAANEHAAFMWIVDNIQHAVILCEKIEGGRDFTCAKKSLP